MFLGEYRTKFTGQGRVVLPKKLREELGKKQEVILSRGWEGCIWGFEKLVWEEQVRKDLMVPITVKRGRDLRRYLFSAAEKVELDDQGRFIITPQLMEYAHLKDEVVIVGAGNYFEIWSKKRWGKLIKQLER